MAKKKNPDDYEHKTPSGKPPREDFNPKDPEFLLAVDKAIQVLTNVRDFLGALNEVKDDHLEKWRKNWEEHVPAWSYGYDSDLVIEMDDRMTLWGRPGRAAEYQLDGAYLPPDEAAKGMILVVVMDDGEFIRAVVTDFAGMDTGLPSITLERIDTVGTRSLYCCHDCGKLGKAEDFQPARDLLQRMLPGDTFTDLECPEEDCGALAFPLKETSDEF